MAETQTLPALLSRVESGEGEDRELDADLWIALCSEKMRSDKFWGWRGIQAKGITDRPEAEVHRDFALRHAPPITSFLDAVIAMVERVKPGAGYRIEWHPQESSLRAWATCGPPGEQEAAYAPTPARALLAALIKAKLMEEQ